MIEAVSGGMAVPFDHKKLRLSAGAALAAAALLAIGPAGADNSGGSRICEGR
jgi:hypothetical protein